MKAEYEKINNQPSSSFMIKDVRVANRLSFKNSWHFHPEIEMIWTWHGQGRKYVGNQVTEFKKGELVLLGSDLPHCWLSEGKVDQLVIQMHPEYLGKGFWQLPETEGLKNFLELSKRGILFEGNETQKVVNLMQQMRKNKGFSRLILLMKALDILSNTKAKSFLTSDQYEPYKNVNDLQRIHILDEYLEKNFSRSISLDEAAKVLNLTKTALCKLIKKTTKTTFSELVNIKRINQASKLLLDTDIAIKDICFNVGFNDQAYFYKQFIRYFNCSPRSYRNNYVIE